MNVVNVNAPTGGSGDLRAIEWYAQYSEFTAYYLTNTNDAFAMQRYVLSANEASAFRMSFSDGK